MKAATSRSDSNMKTLSYILMVFALVLLGFTIGRAVEVNNQANNTSQVSTEGARFVLKPYTGVGSGVYKHGTIVKVVDGQPQVVGNFNDETGKLSAGTVELVEVK